MRLAIGLLILVLGSLVAAKEEHPIFPQEFSVRNPKLIEGGDNRISVYTCKADWIRTNDGWIASCAN